MPTEIEVPTSAVRRALASALASIHFRPMEKKLLIVLADGEYHPMKVLVKEIDELATNHNLSNHVANINEKITPLGHLIICEFNRRRLCYRYVLTLKFLAALDS